MISFTGHAKKSQVLFAKAGNERQDPGWTGEEPQKPRSLAKDSRQAFRTSALLPAAKSKDWA